MFGSVLFRKIGERSRPRGTFVPIFGDHLVVVFRIAPFEGGGRYIYGRMAVNFLFGIDRLQARLRAPEQHFGCEHVIKDIGYLRTKQELHRNFQLCLIRIKQFVFSVFIRALFGGEGRRISPFLIFYGIAGIESAVRFLFHVIDERFVRTRCNGVVACIFVPVGAEIGRYARAARGEEDGAERR